ncbi:MAG: hypothetical protein HY516_03960 [Candidatus Aenigmarchaeota archaeon]|nr:hypothetical protein [Candidatus Aenigmarchaeota archaeon]
MTGDNKLTYAHSGVDRNLRAASKTGLAGLQSTYRFSRHGPPIKLPYGMITPIGGGRYADPVIEGVGTKVLIAQLAGRYDTIGVDAIAMAANDVIRSGADVRLLVDNIDLQRSDPSFVDELMKGLVEGAEQAGAPLVGGEIADVPALMNGIRRDRGFHIVVAAYGELDNSGIIRGDDLVPGDVVIGLRSSGVHSNGISLVRRTLFREWGGLYEPADIPEGLQRSVGEEVLEPTRIYVRPIGRIKKYLPSYFNRPKAAVHITGDAYLKFDKLQEASPGTGFEFDNFHPQPIFAAMQSAAGKMGKEIDDEEMFRTFNMGWGFAVVVSPQYANQFIEAMGEGEPIGRVTDTGRITIRHGGKAFDLER